MALTNLDKDNLTRLFTMINLDDCNNHIDIKSNYSAYCKLQLIQKQMDFLKQEANSIISDYNLNSEINQIKSNFKKTPGNYYYLYQTNNKKTISLIAPHEWTNYDSFIAKVFLDYDFNYYIIS